MMALILILALPVIPGSYSHSNQTKSNLDLKNVALACQIEFSIGTLGYSHPSLYDEEAPINFLCKAAWSLIFSEQ